jgi:hypothetical protein
MYHTYHTLPYHTIPYSTIRLRTQLSSHHVQWRYEPKRVFLQMLRVQFLHGSSIVLDMDFMVFQSLNVNVPVGTCNIKHDELFPPTVQLISCIHLCFRHRMIFANLIWIIRTNSYTKKSQNVRFYTVPDMSWCGTTPSSGEAILQHFGVTEKKNSFSSVVSKCSIKFPLMMV